MYCYDFFSQIGIWRFFAVIVLLSFPIFRFDRTAKKFPWKQWLMSMSILILVMILINKLF